MLLALATSCTWTEEEGAVKDLHNQARAAAGIHALAPDETLAKYADSRCQEITGQFSHAGWENIGYGIAGENIARGQGSPAEVMAAWMASPAHRDNVLYSGFDLVGIGHCTAGGLHYWTAEFGG